MAPFEQNARKFKNCKSPAKNFIQRFVFLTGAVFGAISAVGQNPKKKKQ